jgi:hypothetical protein
MATEQLTDQVTVGGSPGGHDVPPIAGRDVTIEAAPDREYVAGGRIEWYTSIPRALPWGIDDVSLDFGSDIYERMLLDAQVRSVVNVFKASVLEGGATLAPAIDQKDEDGYEQSVDIAGRAERMLADLASPLDDVLWDMLDAVALGNRVAEQVFALESALSGRQEYTLQTLAVKPRDTVAFVVDAYLNVLGILGRIPGMPFPVQVGMLLADLEETPNLLPRSKFAALTFRPKNNDPRGTSILRAAFDPWNQKQQLKREFLKYLTQFATPSLLGFTAENAQPYPLKNPDGSYQTDTNGQPIMRSPEEDMLLALQAFANGTAAVFPYGATVQPIEMAGAGEPFLNAFEFLDRQITKAVLHQTLATEEGQHQTRAASGTHKDILDTIVRQAKHSVERMIQRDILRVWLQLNGEVDALELLPTVGLGTAEEEDLAPLWTAAASLNKADYLHSSQYAELDRMLGLPERTPADATTAPVGEQVQIKTDGVIEPIETPADSGGEGDDGDAGQ